MYELEPLVAAPQGRLELGAAPRRRAAYQGIIAHQDAIRFPNSGNALRDFCHAFPGLVLGAASTLRPTHYWAGVPRLNGESYVQEELAYRFEALRAVSQELERLEQESGARVFRCRVAFDVMPALETLEEYWAEAHTALRERREGMMGRMGIEGVVRSPSWEALASSWEAQEVTEGVYAVGMRFVDEVPGLVGDIATLKHFEEHLFGAEQFRGLPRREVWLPPELGAYLREKVRRGEELDRDERWVFERYVLRRPGEGSRERRPRIGIGGEVEKGRLPFGLL